MKRLFAILLSCAVLLTACGSAAAPSSSSGSASTSETRTITDMAGRTVTVPAAISKVYSTGQPGIVAMYTINPDKLLGWCMSVSQMEREYFEPKYLVLPVLGQMQGKNNTVNKEELIKRNPDIILYMGDMTDAAIDTCNRNQEDMGIPVVMVDFELQKLGEAYAFLGDLLAEQERCQKLAAYYKNVMDYAKNTVVQIPQDERVTVYYAQSATGLQTCPPGVSHSEVIDLIGGVNVAQLPVQGADNRIEVNMEQVLAWNPQVILSSDDHTTPGAYNFISRGDDAWKQIDAVKNNRVYHVPAGPYDFLDKPPAANRIIGILWLGKTLYPNYFDLDIKEKIKEFYELFYRRTLTDEEINKLAGL